MWEPRVIYQQSYIYTTVNIIRSREPCRYKTFPQTIPFPQFLFIHNFSLQKLTALQKVQNKRTAKLRWLLQINEQSIHTFFSAMGRRLGLLPCLNGGLGYLIMYHSSMISRCRRQIEKIIGSAFWSLIPRWPIHQCHLCLLLKGEVHENATFRPLVSADMKNGYQQRHCHESAGSVRIKWELTDL